MPKTKIEIARSYSQKVNLGNYTTADFFMSAKSEVDESEVEKKSKELYDLCRREVEKSIEEYLEELPKPSSGEETINLPLIK
jgi:hypothetical protein